MSEISKRSCERQDDVCGAEGVVQDEDDGTDFDDECCSEAHLRQMTGEEDLACLRSLVLTVDTNFSQVDHLGTLMPHLVELRLNKGSTLASFRDLGSSLKSLRILWIPACGVQHLDGVGALLSLEELYLAFNDVEDLTSIAMHERLEVLDLESNNVQDAEQAMQLGTCPRLWSLTLTANPVCGDMHYRRRVVEAVPALVSLDEQEVTNTDRILPPSPGERDTIKSFSHTPGSHLEQQQGSSNTAASLTSPDIKSTNASYCAPCKISADCGSAVGVVTKKHQHFDVALPKETFGMANAEPHLADVFGSGGPITSTTRRAEARVFDVVKEEREAVVDEETIVCQAIKRLRLWSLSAGEENTTATRGCDGVQDRGSGQQQISQYFDQRPVRITDVAVLDTTATDQAKITDTSMERGGGVLRIGGGNSGGRQRDELLLEVLRLQDIAAYAQRKELSPESVNAASSLTHGSEISISGNPVVGLRRRRTPDLKNIEQTSTNARRRSGRFMYSGPRGCDSHDSDARGSDQRSSTPPSADVVEPQEEGPLDVPASRARCDLHVRPASTGDSRRGTKSTSGDPTRVGGSWRASWNNGSAILPQRRPGSTGSSISKAVPATDDVEVSPLSGGAAAGVASLATGLAVEDGDSCRGEVGRGVINKNLINLAPIEISAAIICTSNNSGMRRGTCVPTQEWHFSGDPVEVCGVTPATKVHSSGLRKRCSRNPSMTNLGMKARAHSSTVDGAGVGLRVAGGISGEGRFGPEWSPTGTNSEDEEIYYPCHRGVGRRSHCRDKDHRCCRQEGDDRGDVSTGELRLRRGIVGGTSTGAGDGIHNTMQDRMVKPRQVRELLEAHNGIVGVGDPSGAMQHHQGKLCDDDRQCRGTPRRLVSWALESSQSPGVVGNDGGRARRGRGGEVAGEGTACCHDRACMSGLKGDETNHTASYRRTHACAPGVGGINEPQGERMQNLLPAVSLEDRCCWQQEGTVGRREKTPEERCCGEAVSEDDDWLVELLRKRPKHVPQLRTRQAFREYFRGMAPDRLAHLLRRAYANCATEECNAKVKKRLQLMEQSWAL